MTGQIEKLTLKSLRVFRMLYLLFFFFICIIVIYQTEIDVMRTKVEIANEFSEQVKTIDSIIIDAQHYVTDVSKLFSSGNLPAYRVELMEQYFLQQNGFFTEQAGNTNIPWALNGKGNFEQLSVNASNLTLQAASYLPFNTSLEKYLGTAVMLKWSDIIVVYPKFFMEEFERSLNNYGRELRLDAFKNMYEAKAQSNLYSSVAWTMPEKSLFNNILSLGLVNKIVDERSNQTLGYVYTDIELERFAKQLNSLQDDHSNVVLTMKHQQQHRVLNKAFAWKKQGADFDIINQPVNDVLPDEVAQHFTLTNDWVMSDDNGVFFISVPLSNSLFRLNYYSNSSYFYQVNTQAIVIRLAALAIIIIFGFVLDRIIRHRFMQPMVRIHQSLVNEQTKTQQTLTKLKEIQSDLVESEKYASLGQIVANVSHKISTPVGIAVKSAKQVQHMLSTLRNNMTDDNISSIKVKRNIDGVMQSQGAVLKNLDRAENLIENFKFITSDSVNDDIKEINLTQYISQTLESLKPEMEHLHINVLFNFDEQIWLKTVAGAINQVVTNLVINAAIHGYGEASKDGDVYVKLFRLNNNAIISITDFGLGMDMATTKQVFEPFYTTKRGGGGTGLGLSICHKLVEQTLFGSITVESALGQGSTFTVSIPIVRKTMATAD